MDAVTTAADAATSADDALVRRARTGDAAAFEVLVDTRIDRCYRLAWSILSNDSDALILSPLVTTAAARMNRRIGGGAVGVVLPQPANRQLTVSAIEVSFLSIVEPRSVTARTCRARGTGSS